MKDKRKTKNKKRSSKVFTQKNNKKGRGIFKKLFRKDLRESLGKKSRKEEEFAEMSHKELIENIVMLLEEAERVEQLENLLNVEDFFNKDNITSLMGALVKQCIFKIR